MSRPVPAAAVVAANGLVRSNGRAPVRGGKNLHMLQAESSSSEEEIDDAPLQRLAGSGKPFGQAPRSIQPSGGKPRSMMSICSSSKKKKKKQATTATYHSQIVDTGTIRLKIRKHKSKDIQPVVVPPLAPVSIADIGARPESGKRRRANANRPNTEREPSSPSASSGEEYDPQRALAFAPASSKHRPHTKVKVVTPKQNKEKKEKVEKPTKAKSSTSKQRRQAEAASSPQSPFADPNLMPVEILIRIFEQVVFDNGTLPTLVRLGRVCQLWHRASLNAELWGAVDLSPHTKEKSKTDYKLAWLLENRLTRCRQLNLANWKVWNMSWIVACVAEYCPRLVELNVAGWRLTGEHLTELVDALHFLERIDLSSTTEFGSSSGCLSAASMAHMTAKVGSRLTHLTLANNKLTSLPQILNSIAANCPSLEVLDVSGLEVVSSTAGVPLETLQKGCSRLRVFRAANADLHLAPASAHLQAESPGFPNLEELSMACPSSNYKLVSDDALSRFLRSATGLRLLDVRGCSQLTGSGLVRIPAWDLQHLFLSGCSVTRKSNSCLELICEKWAHSLLEVDLAWTTVGRSLDAAVEALADNKQSKLKILNLCGSAVSMEPVKKVLLKCACLESLNLSSCRGLPRGIKRHYVGKELFELRDSFDPARVKAKAEAARLEEEAKEKAEKEENSKKQEEERTKIEQVMDVTSAETPTKSKEDSASPSLPETPSDLKYEMAAQSSVESKEEETAESKSEVSPSLKEDGPGSNQSSSLTEASPTTTSRSWNLEQFSPMTQATQDSSSTPTPRPSSKASGSRRLTSPRYSPMARPNAVQASPDPQRPNSWNLEHFSSPAKIDQPGQIQQTVPMSDLTQNKQSNWNLDQFSPSPVGKPDLRTSPEGLKPEPLKPGWNLGQFSPVAKPDTLNQFAAQASPYSAQPSPYSTQPSPYSVHSQQSPYSAQPSPDTSQAVKTDSQKITPSAWNHGQFSPITKQVPYTSQQSPDSGPPNKVAPDTSKINWNLGQFSPMTRQDRAYAAHSSPYSPRPATDPPKRSPAAGKFSPMMRPEVPIPSPDTRQPGSWNFGHFSPMSSVKNAVPSPDTSTSVKTSWGGTAGYSPTTVPLPPSTWLPQTLETNQTMQPAWNCSPYGASSRLDPIVSDTRALPNAHWTLPTLPLAPPISAPLLSGPDISHNMWRGEPTYHNQLVSDSLKDRTGYINAVPNTAQSIFGPMEPLNGPSGR